MDLTNVLASKNKINKEKLVNKDILKPTNEFLNKFRNNGNSLNTATAKLVNNLCIDKPEHLDYVMNSGVI